MTMIHEITSVTARYKKRLRVGRGEGSGHGKTCGRGTKGSGARVGKPTNAGHEGGQTRIYRRLPKRGFSNHDWARNFQVVNLADIEAFAADGATVDAAALQQAKLIPNASLPVKILGEGSLTKKLTVVADWYSKSAHQKITAAGGTAQNAEGQPFEFPKPKKRFVKRAAAPKAAKQAAEAPAADAAKAEAPKAEAPKADAPQA